MADFLLLEDGSHLVLEDGTGDLLLESSTAGPAAETAMLCARISTTLRLVGSPSLSPAVDAAGLSVNPRLKGTVSIEEC